MISVRVKRRPDRFHYAAIKSVGMQRIRGKQKKLEAFGFKPAEINFAAIARGEAL